MLWWEWGVLLYLLLFLIFVFGIGLIDCSTLCLLVLAALGTSSDGLFGVNVFRLLGHETIAYGLIGFAALWQITRQRFV